MNDCKHKPIQYTHLLSCLRPNRLVHLTSLLVPTLFCINLVKVVTVHVMANEKFHCGTYILPWSCVDAMTRFIEDDASGIISDSPEPEPASEQ